MVFQIMQPCKAQFRYSSCHLSKRRQNLGPVCQQERKVTAGYSELLKMAAPPPEQEDNWQLLTKPQL